MEKNLIKDLEYFKEINQVWNKLNGVYISAITFASIAADLSILSLIPVFWTGAFIAGTAASVAASSLSVVLNLQIETLKSKIQENNNFLLAVTKYIAKISTTFVGFAFNLFSFLENLKFYIVYSVAKAGTEIVWKTSRISFLVATIQIVLMGVDYIIIRSKKEKYISSVKKEFNNQIQNSIKKINSEIYLLDGNIYKKYLEIINIRSLNIKLYDEIENFSGSNNLLINHFTQLSNSITNFPLITKNKIFQIAEKSKKNIKKLKHKNLKELYKKLELFNINSKQKSQNRKQNKKEFYNIYNYDDKNYWSKFLFTWAEPLLNYTEILFI